MHLRIKLATAAFAAGALVATLAPATPPATVVTPTVPSTSTSSAASLALASTSSTPTKPRAARVAFKALSGVKKSKLRRQKPKQTKRWKKRAARAINASLHRRITPKDGYHAVASFWFCAIALARFVAEYAIPIAKVVRVLREAIRLFRTFRGVLEAWNDGTLLKMMGEDAADVVKAVFGAGDFLNDCIL